MIQLETGNDDSEQGEQTMYQLVMYGADDRERVEYYSSREDAVYHLMHDCDKEYNGGIIFDENFNEVMAW